MRLVRARLVAGHTLLAVCLLAGCAGQPGLPVDLSADPLPPGTAPTRASPPAGWVFGFDRRLEAKEDARMNASLLDLLERRTGLSLGLRMTARRGSVVQDLCEGRVDFAIAGAVSYLQARARCGARIVARGVSADGSDRYRAAIVVPADSPVRDLAELQGRWFVFGPESSTQGSLIPQMMLCAAGVTPQTLAGSTHTESHAATADLVTSGTYDAGGLQEKLAGDLAAHGLVRVVATSEPFMASGVVAGPEVPEETLALVRDALLSVRPDGVDRAALYTWERSEMPRGFVPARDEEYRGLQGLLDYAATGSATPEGCRQALAAARGQ